MLDRLPLDQEHHVLGDVRREVRDALQVAAHEEQVHPGADDVRILHHMREQDPEHRAVQGVHAVVAT